jgi:hypothetical protein
LRRPVQRSRPAQLKIAWRRAGARASSVETPL